jgi:hypothetical protein
LAIKHLEYKKKANFKNKSRDEKKHLKLMERGVMKLLELHFMYFLYNDEYKNRVMFTLKAIEDKLTIINLKEIRLEDFGDQEAEIGDIPGYI